MPGVLGTGSTISIGGTIVGSIKDIKPSGQKLKTVDCSTLESTALEYNVGIPDNGDIDLTGFATFSNVDGQAAMRTAFANKTLVPVVITFPTSTGATLSCNAYVSELQWGIPFEDNIDFTAKLKISGALTFAVAASNNLSALTCSEDGDIVPNFAAATYDYVITVLTGVTSITVTPTAAAGVITVNGSVVATGVASSAIVLGAAGSLTTVQIVVTETGKAAKVYNIKVLRA